MAENYDQILASQYGSIGTAGSASSTLYGYDRSQVGQLEAERER